MASIKEVRPNRDDMMIPSSEGSDLENIRKDMEALKSDVLSLGRHIGKNGAQTASSFATLLQQQTDALKATGQESLKKAEQQIREHPSRTLAIAFASGLVLSFLLGRR